MGLRALFARLYFRNRRTSANVATFPSEVFWRSVCSLKQPVLLVVGDGLEVVAATEEAHELFGSNKAIEICNLLKSGLDPHILERIQLATKYPASLVTDLPIRMQSQTAYLNVSVTVSMVPEYPAQNAALLFLKDLSGQSFPAWALITREVLSRVPLPAWVVDSAGGIVFSNASYRQFPLERVRTELSATSTNQEVLERMSRIQSELSRLQAKSRVSGAVMDSTYDMGEYGHWRVVHFPLKSADTERVVAVLAMPIDAVRVRGAGGDDEIISAETSQATLAHVLQVREAERTALARELHDSVGQELHVLKLELRQLNNLVVTTAGSTPTVVTQFESVRELVDRIAKTARRIAYQMRQDLANVKGLAHSVQELVLDLRNRLGVQIQLEIDQGWVEPEPGMAHNMYRSVQEMLNNVSKHSMAKRCLVRMGLNDSMYWLDVSDDGVGMPAVRKTRSIGLSSLTERAEIYGGRVIITSRPEVEGTLVRIELPERRIQPAGKGSG